MIKIPNFDTCMYLDGDESTQLYELQIYDSAAKESPGLGDCGAIYQIRAPDVNATLSPGEWQPVEHCERRGEQRRRQQPAHVRHARVGALLASAHLEPLVLGLQVGLVGRPEAPGTSGDCDLFLRVVVLFLEENMFLFTASRRACSRVLVCAARVVSRK